MMLISAAEQIPNLQRSSMSPVKEGKSLVTFLRLRKPSTRRVDTRAQSGHGLITINPHPLFPRSQAYRADLNRTLLYLVWDIACRLLMSKLDLERVITSFPSADHLMQSGEASWWERFSFPGYIATTRNGP
jgi:hypothetical protein